MDKLTPLQAHMLKIADDRDGGRRSFLHHPVLTHTVAGASVGGLLGALGASQTSDYKDRRDAAHKHRKIQDTATTVGAPGIASRNSSKAEALEALARAAMQSGAGYGALGGGVLGAVSGYQAHRKDQEMGKYSSGKVSSMSHVNRQKIAGIMDKIREKAPSFERAVELARDVVPVASGLGSAAEGYQRARAGKDSRALHAAGRGALGGALVGGAIGAESGRVNGAGLPHKRTIMRGSAAAVGTPMAMESATTGGLGHLAGYGVGKLMGKRQEKSASMSPEDIMARLARGASIAGKINNAAPVVSGIGSAVEGYQRARSGKGSRAVRAAGRGALGGAAVGAATGAAQTYDANRITGEILSPHEAIRGGAQAGSLAPAFESGVTGGLGHLAGYGVGKLMGKRQEKTSSILDRAQVLFHKAAPAVAAAGGAAEGYHRAISGKERAALESAGKGALATGAVGAGIVGARDYRDSRYHTNKLDKLRDARTWGTAAAAGHAVEGGLASGLGHLVGYAAGERKRSQEKKSSMRKIAEELYSAGEIREDVMLGVIKEAHAYRQSVEDISSIKLAMARARFFGATSPTLDKLASRGKPDGNPFVDSILGTLGAASANAAVGVVQKGWDWVTNRDADNINMSYKRMMASNPEFQKDEELVQQHFGVLKQFAPSLASNPLAAAGHVRQSMEMGNMIPIDTVRSLAQTEKLHQESGPKSWMLGAS